ncbi:threonylcarbamoyl-AMP synthase [Marivibrio halodurans]|uniref:Threonylcarbamoyl-AMP synthase n=1 Tax=Marivibrio halodurans TaxID=2039722 RepID=A0A8J7SHJ1_9PROT|nr:L-threonylcarbamoyladenylate synthase [Marivibrio halodurans]MBP5856448.1 threonylcarbamoyl-AMP synthase [Marivibrio halodurans]
MTPILPIEDDKALTRAADMLRGGGLVAFPTETVYGLGALAESEGPVARIFEAKGRPRFNPLIVHLPDRAALDRYVVVPQEAERLAAAFWPGALTLVLPRKAGAPLSLLASAGLPTVAVRIPGHARSRALLRAVDGPVAAPSANRSGRLSPVEAAHVEASLGGAVDLILDGGRCDIGLESTIVDMSGPRPTLLRPGGVAAEEIEALLAAPLRAHDGDAAGKSAPKAPGMLASHYAPGLPIRLAARAAREGEAFIGFADINPPDTFASLSAAGDLREAAANLFPLLHRADDPARFTGIAVAPVPETGLGRAINDRLRRAAAPRD